MALRSWAKSRPVSSSLTLPMKPALTPKEATPAAVFAPDPPETIVAGPMAPKSSSARASSMSCIAPLWTFCAARKASSVFASTSTMALPRVSTSIEGGMGGPEREGRVARFRIRRRAGQERQTSALRPSLGRSGAGPGRRPRSSAASRVARMRPTSSS